MRKQLHTTLLLLFVAISFSAAQSDRQNLIQLENAKPGSARAAHDRKLIKAIFETEIK